MSDKKTFESSDPIRADEKTLEEYKDLYFIVEGFFRSLSTLGARCKCGDCKVHENSPEEVNRCINWFREKVDEWKKKQ